MIQTNFGPFEVGFRQVSSFYLFRSGLHNLFHPTIRDGSTWSKFRAQREHGDVFLTFVVVYLKIFISCLFKGSQEQSFFPSGNIIYGISRDGSKNFNKRTCEHMILGQLRMRARQAKNAPLSIIWPFWSILTLFDTKTSV